MPSRWQSSHCCRVAEWRDAVGITGFVVALSAGVLAGGLVAAPAAVAAPPTRIENTVDELSCVFETQEGDLVFFVASASSDGSAGSRMFVENPAMEVLLDGQGGSAVFGATFSAVVTLVDLSTGEPVGDATVQAIFGVRR